MATRKSTKGTGKAKNLTPKKDGVRDLSVQHDAANAVRGGGATSKHIAGVKFE